MTDLRTCHWCGKHYYYNNIGNYSWYCSTRCKAAAEREKKREEEERRRKREEIIKQGGLGAKFLKIWDIIKWSAIIIGVIGFLCCFLYLNRSINASNSSIHSNDNNKSVQESVKKQLSVNDNMHENGMEVNEDQNTGESLEVKEPQSDQLYSRLDVANEERADFFTYSQNNTDETNETGNVIEDVGVITEREDYSKQKVYDIVDVMPIYPDGDHELMEFIAANVDYPKEAIEKGIEGRVFVKFIVEPDGSISNASIVRGIGYGCDEEAIRVIESMPAWEPGRKNGKVVRVSMTAPVSFNLR